MSRETKIGLFAVLSIAILVIGFQFLKGKNVFSSSQTFYVNLENVTGLQISTPVTVNGVQVGTVQGIDLTPDLRTVNVTLDISGDVQVPEATVAKFFTGVMGGVTVELDFQGLNCAAAPCAESGDQLRGQYYTLLASLATPDDLKNYVEVFTDGFGDIADSLSAQFDEDSRMGQAFSKVESILGNVDGATRQLNSLMAGTRRDLDALVNNMRLLSDTLAAGSGDIDAILTNAETLTAKLSRIDWESTAGSADQAVKSLERTLATAERTLSDLSGAVKNVTQGEGTLAQIINDKELYRNLTQMTDQFALLSADIRLQPERYRRILSKKTKTDPITELPPEGTLPDDGDDD